MKDEKPKAFPRVSTLNLMIENYNIRQSKSYLDKNSELVEKIIKRLGEGMEESAMRGNSHFQLDLVAEKLFMFESQSDFDACSRIVSERITEWDDFDVLFDFGQRTITIKWVFMPYI